MRSAGTNFPSIGVALVLALGACSTNADPGLSITVDQPSRLCAVVETLRPKMQASDITFTDLVLDDSGSEEAEALSGALTFSLGAGSSAGPYRPAVAYLVQRFSAEGPTGPSRPAPPTRSTKVLASANRMDRDLLEGDGCDGERGP